MISVIVPTLNSERLLVPTLSPLVAGAAEGLVREVLFADAGSEDATERIAEAAGCELVRGPAGEGERLRMAAEAARSDWLLFLEPGSALEEGWTREVGAFLGATAADASAPAAVFRLTIADSGLGSRLAETVSAIRLALAGRARPDQGLLVAKARYDSVGGHPSGPHPRRALLARLGRVTGLRTRLTMARSGLTERLSTRRPV